MSDWTQDLVISGLMWGVVLFIVLAEYMDSDRFSRGGFRAVAALLGITTVVVAIKEL